MLTAIVIIAVAGIAATDSDFTLVIVGCAFITLIAVGG